MMLDVTLLCAQTFLPLPYEAALAPRLKWIQEKKLRREPWVRLAARRTEETDRLRAATARLRAGSRILAVLGGGPGPRGLAECLRVPGGGPELLFLDSGDEWERVLPLLEGGEFSAAVMPGGEEDPALCRLSLALRALLERRHGPEEAQRRFLSLGEGPETLPRGGWDLLGTAGLLPAAAAGADVDALLAGAAEMAELCGKDTFENPAWRYAAIRHQLYRSGWAAEVLAGYGDSSLRWLLEWRQRLCAGSEAREDKGLFPAWALYPQDLSTLGQAVLGGKLPVVETVLALGGADRLRAQGLEPPEQALLPHAEGGVPLILLRAPDRSARTLGGLVSFFQYACGLSCGLLDVDPFRPLEAAGQERLFSSEAAGEPGLTGKL